MLVLIFKIGYYLWVEGGKQYDWGSAIINIDIDIGPLISILAHEQPNIRSSKKGEQFLDDIPTSPINSWF